jgi:hypothetical protein
LRLAAGFERLHECREEAGMAVHGVRYGITGKPDLLKEENDQIALLEFKVLS